MNNDRFEHELSQFLDGRLPNGRREQLLDHLDTDETAARLLDEMEAAQELARTLPALGIGSGFSETLWQRIRSGEGTPEAVFREPLSPWVKARYAATGALAAAAVLIAFSVLYPVDRDPEVVAPPAGEQLADAADTAAMPGDAGLGRFRRATPGTGDRPPVSFASLQPDQVALAGQRECIDALATLQTQAAFVERRIEEVEPRDLFVELEPGVGRLDGATHLIRWMQRTRIVQLPTDFDMALSMSERMLRRMREARTSNDPIQLRVAVQDLKELDVDRLRDDFYTRCCVPPEEFESLLLEQIAHNPDLGRPLRVFFFRTHHDGPGIPIQPPSLGTWNIGPGVIRGSALMIDGNSSVRIDRRRAPDGRNEDVQVRVEVWDGEPPMRMPTGR